MWVGTAWLLVVAATFPLLTSCLPAHCCPVKNVAGKYMQTASMSHLAFTVCQPIAVQLKV
jgi:hypothetical protein